MIIRTRLRTFLPLFVLLPLMLAAWTRCQVQEPPRPRGIVLIVIDTLRADRLASYGYSRQTSPAIDRLATEGMLFEQAMSAASYTKPGTASIVTGHWPMVHGALDYDDEISPDVQTLAEALAAHGYRTAGFYLNGNAGATFGFGRGYETYKHPQNQYISRKRKQGRLTGRPRLADIDDGAVTEVAIPHLRSLQDQPFFLYLHFIGPHDPYCPPREFAKYSDPILTEPGQLFYQEPIQRNQGELTILERVRRGEWSGDTLTRDLRNLYDDEILFTDRQIGVVMEELEALGRLDDTLVIVTSDHGEELGDRGGWGHGYSHYQEQLRVPLIVRGAGIAKGRWPKAVSTTDLFPTILELVGAPVPGGLGGVSRANILFGARSADSSPLIAEGRIRDISMLTLREDQTKLILDRTRQKKFLFDLSQDPSEEHNLLEDDPRSGERPLRKLARLNNDLLEQSRSLRSQNASMEEDLVKELRALGYVADSSPPSATLQEFRVVDPRPFGLFGTETRLDAYQERLVLTDPDARPQLIFGLEPHRRGAWLTTEAALRLGRPSNARAWRLAGMWHNGPGGRWRLSVRVNGQPMEATVRNYGMMFVASGRVPAVDEDTIRIDVECDAPRAVSCARLIQASVEPEPAPASSSAWPLSTSADFSQADYPWINGVHRREADFAWATPSAQLVLERPRRARELDVALTIPPLRGYEKPPPELEIRLDGEGLGNVRIERPGPLRLRLPVPATTDTSPAVVEIELDQSWSPGRRSKDTRTLSFMINRVALIDERQAP